jgi:hypothetical protein
MGVRGRHLALPFLLDHIESGIPTVYSFPGEPTTDLLIEGDVPRLTLRANYGGGLSLPANVLKNVQVRQADSQGIRRISVAVEGRELIIDGHAMLCVMADRIQLEGLDPMRAVAETLQQWREVLAARKRASTEQEVGLVGELLVLEALQTITGASALETWRGASNEEHDFGLKHMDVEVKTTSTERRTHWISSPTQLQRTQDRPLTLVSIQITRGGKSGRTLPAIIGDLRKSLDLESFNKKLSRVAWDDDLSDLYPERWIVRTAPAAFAVDEEFPAITPAILAETVTDAGLVTDLRYRLDLTDRKADPMTDADLRAALALLTPSGATN